VQDYYGGRPDGEFSADRNRFGTANLKMFGNQEHGVFVQHGDRLTIGTRRP
jgi:hypothetical protein